MSQRVAEDNRKTAETDITLRIDLDGSGRYNLNTEIPFLEHMLSHLSRHGLFDIDLKLRGDLGIDAHHSVEDTAIVLGNLIDRALGDRAGIERYGHSILPMDEVLVTVAVDLGGRASFRFQGPDHMNVGKFGNYDAELTLEFLEKLARHTRMNLHVIVHSGANRHHIHEAIFKALGRALRQAVRLDERLGGRIPSTKEVL